QWQLEKVVAPYRKIRQIQKTKLSDHAGFQSGSKRPLHPPARKSQRSAQTVLISEPSVRPIAQCQYLSRYPIRSEGKYSRIASLNAHKHKSKPRPKTIPIPANPMEIARKTANAPNAPIRAPNINVFIMWIIIC